MFLPELAIKRQRKERREAAHSAREGSDVSEEGSEDDNDENDSDGDGNDDAENVVGYDERQYKHGAKGKTKRGGVYWKLRKVFRCYGRRCFRIAVAFSSCASEGFCVFLCVAMFYFITRIVLFQGTPPPGAVVSSVPVTVVSSVFPLKKKRNRLLPAFKCHPRQATTDKVSNLQCFVGNSWWNLCVPCLFMISDETSCSKCAAGGGEEEPFESDDDDAVSIPTSVDSSDSEEVLRRTGTKRKRPRVYSSGSKYSSENCCSAGG